MRAAVFDQPNKQLPRLIPQTKNVESHLELARRVDLFSIACKTQEKSDMMCSNFVCQNDPRVIIDWRTEVLEEIKNQKRNLAPVNEKLQKNVEINASAKELDLALLSKLIEITNAPDKNLVTDLATGMPLSGDTPAAASLRKETPKERITIEAIMENIEIRNKKIVHNLMNQSPEDRQLCYDITCKEINESKVAPLRVATENDLKTKILTPRFIVHQDKPRIIDNLKASRVNETASRSDTYVPDTLDKLMVQIRSLRVNLDKLGRSEGIKMFSFDFQSAYKHIGIDKKSKIASTIIILDPVSKLPMIAEMLCQPFGSALSPRNWGRVVETIKFLGKALFHVDTKYFVDDGFGAEPESTAESAFFTITQLACLLGFKIHPDKLVPPTEVIKLLGAIIAITNEQIIVKNPKPRLRKIRTLLAKILVDRKLSPRQQPL